MNKNILFAALIASVAALPLAASAGTQSAPLSVTATVVNDCSITVPSPFNVTSAYDFLAATDATNTENGSVNCTVNSQPAIGLGPYDSTIPINVSLSNGSNYLKSTLAASAISGGTFTLTEDIAAGQNVPAGSYSASTIVYVNF